MARRGEYKIQEHEFWSAIRERESFQVLAITLDEPYKGGETRITVACPEHGNRRSKVANLLRSTYGCPGCANRARARRPLTEGHRAKISKAKAAPSRDIRQRLRARFATLGATQYEFVLTDYVSYNRGKIVALCREHGESIFSPPSTIFRAKFPCRPCANERRARAHATSWEEFVSRAHGIHEGRFEFLPHSDGFSNLSSKVILSCNAHGEQIIRASKILQGQYCRKCRKVDGAKGGLYPGGLSTSTLRENLELASKSARLYYARVGRHYKIGITTSKDRNARYRSLKSRSGHNVRVLEEVSLSLQEAFAVEQKVLSEFAEFRLYRPYSTELFSEDVLAPHGGLQGFVESLESEAHPLPSDDRQGSEFS